MEVRPRRAAGRTDRAETVALPHLFAFTDLDAVEVQEGAVEAVP